MTSPQALLAHLDAIGRSLKKTSHAPALIGLGSVGLELRVNQAMADAIRGFRG